MLDLPLLVLLRHRDADPVFAAEWLAAVGYAWEMLEYRALGALLKQSVREDGIDTRLALAIVGQRDKAAQSVKKASPVDSAAVARVRAELRALAGFDAGQS
jgi:hypothetical protein